MGGRRSHARIGRNMDNQEIDKVEAEITNKNAVEERVRKAISDKKEAEAKFEQAEKARLEYEAKLSAMEKQTKFLEDFSTVTTKFPTASEFKDKIRDKVASGYSVDDATVAVLHAEGKLSSSPVQSGNVAGGSAPNQITNSPQKTVKEMASTERWAALREAELKGDIGMS